MNHMKIKKSFIFVKKNLKINVQQIKNIVKLWIIALIPGAVHSIWNLKQSAPKNISLAFHNRSNYDYHFIIRVSRRI